MGKTEELEKNLPWYKFVYHKPHMDWREMATKLNVKYI